MNTFKNFTVSVIRTLVPTIVGFITAWATTKGLNLSDDTTRVLTLALEGLFGMGYYLVVRWLEHVNDRFGWLLGYAKMPSYTEVPEFTGPKMTGNFSDIIKPTAQPDDSAR